MPKVMIIIGSKSDLPVADKAIDILKELSVSCGISVASAHRTPKMVEDIVTNSDASVFIAIAGLSAALPGVIASFTSRPVIGVPVSGKLNMDSILSIVQMPPGIPVAAVGLDRGENAGMLAAQILAISDNEITERINDHRKKMASQVAKDSEEVSRNV